MDSQTIDKYLNGYQSNKTKTHKLKIDDFLRGKKLFLSDGTPQKFYYERVLWQYLGDNRGLNCAESSFRAYISRKPEFQQYFDSRKGELSRKQTVRIETPPSEIAQFDWKENIRFVTKNVETLYKMKSFRFKAIQ